MKNKQLIVFDLDGTLTESKSPLAHGEAVFLWELLERKKVGVISGATWGQLNNQFLTHFCAANPPEECFTNLYLMPTCGSALYNYQDTQWKSVYEEVLIETERDAILDAFDKAIPRLSYDLGTPYGKRIEDRGCQITFSALGQDAPLKEKKAWDTPSNLKRLELKDLLNEYLHDAFEIRVDGATSIDVARKGIDKPYGIDRLARFLNVRYEDILFIGDALFNGGSDYPVKAMGIDCVEVKGPRQAVDLIIQLLGEE